MSRSVEALLDWVPGSRSAAQPGSNYALGTRSLLQGSVYAPFDGSERSHTVGELPGLPLDAWLRPAGLTVSKFAEPSETARANAVLEENCNTRITTAEAAVQRRLQAEERSRDEQRQRQSASVLAECQSRITQRETELQEQIRALQANMREQKSDFERQLAAKDSEVRTLATTRLELDRVQASLVDTQQRLQVQTAARGEAEASLTDAKLQLQMQTDALTRANASLGGSERTVAELRTLHSACTDAARLSTEAARAKERELTEQVTTLTSQLAATERQRAESEAKAATATDASASKVRVLSEQVAALTSQLEAAQAQQTASEAKAAAATEEAKTLKESEASVQRLGSACQEEVKDLKQQIATKNTQLGGALQVTAVMLKALQDPADINTYRAYFEKESAAAAAWYDSALSLATST